MAGHGAVRGTLRAGRGPVLLIAALAEGQAREEHAGPGSYGSGPTGRGREDNERRRADSHDRHQDQVGCGAK